MLTISRILFLPLLPTFTAVSVKIDGVIDLGPNWNYKYTLQTEKQSDSFKPSTNLAKRSRNDETNVIKLVENEEPLNNGTNYKTPNISIGEKVTKAENAILNMYTNAHKIRNDKANEFLKHVYKQSLTVFDSIKDKVNDYNLRRHIEALTKNYHTKFNKFITETQNQTIKTTFGSQKVIMNAIAVSNGLISRLVRSMLGDLAKRDLLRNKMAVNIVEKEVSDLIQMEYRHACTKFGVCRTDNTFSKFMTDILTILLTNNDAKLKQAADAFTETVKYNTFNTVLSENVSKKFQLGVEGAEIYDIGIIRPFLTIIRNILSNKYNPLVIMGNWDERVNKTVALLNMVEIVDKNIPGNEINSLEWNDIKNSVIEWSDGKRNDILDIMQTLVNYLKKSLDRMDSNCVQNVSNIIGYIIN